MPAPEPCTLAAEPEKHLVLELTVDNHPGVMSHVCGLFARRAFNMDGILCMPVGEGQLSRIWIRVARDGQLEQIVKQLRKLEDVREVRHQAAGHEVFVRLEGYFDVRAESARD